MDQKDPEMLPADAATLLNRFSGEYGRFCVLIASALHSGRPRPWVLAAGRGQGKQYRQREYVEIRWQHSRCHSLISMCKAAGVTDRDIVDAAYAARTTVEQEFMLTIPRMDR